MEKNLSLDEIKKRLKEKVINDLITAIGELKKIIVNNTSLYNTVISISAKINDLNKQNLRGILSIDELHRHYAIIRNSVLEIIDSLTENDISGKEKNIKYDRINTGSVLYKIPQSMFLGNESKCVIRIAFDIDEIIKDIEIDNTVQVKDLPKVSRTMEVKLQDPSAKSIFHIRTTSESIQLIDKEHFTEWKFYVTPTRTGYFPLDLKISIIEYVNGLPYKKEIVVEEKINIVLSKNKSEIKEEEPYFKQSEHSLSFYSSDFTMSNPFAQEKVRLIYQFRKNIRPIAIALALLIFSTSVAFASTTAETRDWLISRYLVDTEDRYELHILKYPKSKHREKATYRKAIITQDFEDYNNYLKEYPNGEFGDEIKKTISKLNKDRLAKLLTNPEIKAFIAYILELKNKNEINENEKLQKLAIDFEDEIWGIFLKHETMENLAQYLYIYPNGKYIPNAKKEFWNEYGELDYYQVNKIKRYWKKYNDNEFLKNNIREVFRKYSIKSLEESKSLIRDYYEYDINIFPEQGEYSEGLLSALSSISHKYVMTKEYKSAILASEKVLEIDRNQKYEWVQTNRVMGYLFFGDEEKARMIYQEYGSKPYSQSNQFDTYREAFLDDLILTEIIGLDSIKINLAYDWLDYKEN